MKDPQELADVISRFVNSTMCSNDELREVAKAMANDHPTLQQKKMKLALMFIEEMAKKPYADARNKNSVDKAQGIVADNKVREIKKLVTEGTDEEKAKEIADKYLALSSNLPTI